MPTTSDCSRCSPSTPGSPSTTRGSTTRSSGWRSWRSGSGSARTSTTGSSRRSMAWGCRWRRCSTSSRTRRAAPRPIARVDHAIDSLNLVITDIRSYILRLRPALAGEEDPVEALVRFTEELGMNAVVDLDVDLEGGADLLRSMPPDRRSDVLFIAREALSNVARHAGATQTVLALRADGDDLVLDDRGQRAGVRSRRARRTRWLRAAPGHRQHARSRRRHGRHVRGPAAGRQGRAYHRPGARGPVRRSGIRCSSRLGDRRTHP